ncbi:N-lysine methyltransferase SETD6 isoform X2 [Hemicordylus capensis]|uniref:N-lysine methyltransferase SETD6 isoform X2 n=1 Tax=Hemicordylus capensis TaxID=884348 RepID=UPI002304B612|nr:N-lysine methyltransferase SETD6 isoform X2 [Hemicordylus capensis]
MASAAKRAKVGPPDALEAFLHWCADVGLELSPKVQVSRAGLVAAGYGLVATEALPAGEVLFVVPRAALLSQHTGALAPLLRTESASLESQSGWVPLLLSLLHESTTSNSHWAPYLALWPGFSGLDHPMFWSAEEQKRLLKGTGVPEAVEKDLANIQLEYSSIILPFMKAHPDVFNPQVHTLELYQKLVAFVMAYSFQEPLDDDDDDEEEEEEEEKEPNPPVMVPMADLLNHVANHNASLEYSPECLKMVTTRPIHKGQEVLNTYGELANWQLLHMYGFAEPYPGNTNDAADIQMLTLRTAALQATKTQAEQQLVLELWDFLCQLEMVGEEGAFVMGWQTVFTEEELAMALKVLSLSAEEFQEFKEQESWEEERGKDGAAYLPLSPATVPKLKASWRKLLGDAIRLTLQLYNSGLKEEEEILGDLQAYSKLSCREQFALQVRYGQKRILQQWLELAA